MKILKVQLFEMLSLYGRIIFLLTGHCCKVSVWLVQPFSLQSSAFAVIFHLTVFPHFVNHRLPVLFFHNHIRKIAELLICKPRDLHFFSHHKQLLKAPIHFVFEFASEVILNYKTQPPQRKITRIIFPLAGNVAVIFTAGNLNELQHRPLIRFPYELKKNIIIDEIIILIRVKNFIRISQNFKILLTL